MPSDFNADKSENERQELVTLMRTTEMKWAKRCTWALGVFVLLICVIVGAVVGASKGDGM